MWRSLAPWEPLNPRDLYESEPSPWILQFLREECWAYMLGFSPSLLVLPSSALFLPHIFPGECHPFPCVNYLPLLRMPKWAISSLDSLIHQVFTEYSVGQTRGGLWEDNG